MPQLDTAWFASQIFWLVITFGVLYLALAGKYLPRVRNILAERRTKIKSDIEEAEKLKNQAEKLRADYEALVAKSRAELSDITSKELASAREGFAKKLAENETEIAKMLEESESKISKEIESAIKNSEGEIQNIVNKILEKSGQVSADDAKIKLAVDNAAKKMEAM